MIAQKRTNERTNKRNSYQFAFLLAVFVINKNESQCEQPLAQHNPKNTKLRRTMSNKRPLLGPSASDGVSKAERKRMKLAMMRLISDESKQFDDNELTNRESRVDGAKRPKSARELAALQAIQSANAATSSQQPHNHTSSTSTTVVEPPTSAAATESKKPRHRRQRVLVFASRGVTDRFRHLMNDVKKLLPHHKSDVKMDKKDNLNIINEICESQSCNKAIYFEVRKRRDLYMWFANVPHGPSVKFHVVNVHTMDELKLTGNALVGSRPILHFDAAFDDTPQFQVLKELFTQTWTTPRFHAKSKPFIDHIICFYLVDNKIWVRNYQIVWPSRDNTEREKKLVEIGPRFVLIPVRIFNAGFGGSVLYENMDYQSPNEQRRIAKQGQPTLADRTNEKQSSVARKEKTIASAPVDVLSGHELFKLAEQARVAREAEEANQGPIGDEDDDDDDEEEEDDVGDDEDEEEEDFENDDEDDDDVNDNDDDNIE